MSAECSNRRCRQPAEGGFRQCVRCRERKRRAKEQGRSPECDCGRMKEHRYSPACDECLRIDGRTAREQEVLGILRDLDGATVDAVAFELGLRRNTAHAALCRMRRRGLLDCHYPPGEREASFGRARKVWRVR